MKLLLAYLFLPLTVNALDSRFEDWAKIRKPTAGPAQTIGFYSAGCLSGAKKLTLDGPGFSVMRPSRRRFFAHPDMGHYLNELSQTLHKQSLPFLLIGDVSPPRGGPMAAGHNSHQGGLDADIWLMMLRKRPNGRDKERLSAVKYVKNRKTLKSIWGTIQVKLVATAAKFDSVNRIFVAPAIKKYFCDHEPSAPWLYKLRAYWGHEEHIHVRLHCPLDSPLCVTQTPVLDPNDSGCGKDLDWWFSKEADEEWQKMNSTPADRQFPELPAECESMV